MGKESKINFGESLSEILLIRNIRIDELSEAIGISQNTIYVWLRNANSIKLSNLVQVANYLKCSISYLIGESTDDSIVTQRKYPKFGSQIRKVMKEYGKSTYYMDKKGIVGKYFNKWDKGSEPYLTTLINLAEIIGCTVDHLIGYEK